MAKMQKFKKGDLVVVAKDLGSSMSHFQADCRAIVLYSYNEKYGKEYGNGQYQEYSLYIEGSGAVSWYRESQLTLLEENRLDLLAEWEEVAKREVAKYSNLVWIFSHGDEVLTKPNGVSINTLAKCLGIVDLWGSRGEGVDYHSNCAKVLALAEPCLLAKDVEAWLLFCTQLQTEQSRM